MLGQGDFQFASSLDQFEHFSAETADEIAELVLGCRVLDMKYQHELAVFTADLVLSCLPLCSAVSLDGLHGLGVNAGDP